MTVLALILPKGGSQIPLNLENVSFPPNILFSELLHLPCFTCYALVDISTATQSQWFQPLEWIWWHHHFCLMSTTNANWWCKYVVRKMNNPFFCWWYDLDFPIDLCTNCHHWYLIPHVESGDSAVAVPLLIAPKNKGAIAWWKICVSYFYCDLMNLFFINYFVCKCTMVDMSAPRLNIKMSQLLPCC